MRLVTERTVPTGLHYHETGLVGLSKRRSVADLGRVGLGKLLLDGDKSTLV
jgi:hypothetical protein